MLSRIGKYTYQKYPILREINSVKTGNTKKKFVTSKLSEVQVKKLLKNKIINKKMKK